MSIKEWLGKNSSRVDWNGIYNDWLVMQKKHNKWRDEQVKIITSEIAKLPFEKINVIDLCCGPGTVSKALLEKDNRVDVIGIDADTFLLFVYNNILKPYGNRVEIIEADIRKPDIYDMNKEIHAVVSLTALHWLSEPSHRELYKRIYKLLVKGGIFINADRSACPEKEPALGKEGMTWNEFWEQLYSKYGFKNEMEEMRSNISIWEGTDEGYARDFFISAMKDAGFADVTINFNRDGKIVFSGKK